MIRCTPVCGPGPVLYCVSGRPDGCCTVNEIVTGRLGVLAAAGLKPARANTRAAATCGTETAEPPELPQPVSDAAPASSTSIVASRRLTNPSSAHRSARTLSRRPTSSERSVAHLTQAEGSTAL